MQRSDFKHIHKTPVRWGDMDTLGHVNNVQFIRYLESGRVAYCEETLGTSFATESKQTWILLDIHATFQSQLHYPCDIEVGTRVSRIGTSSADLRSAIFPAGCDTPALTSKAIIVWFDYSAQESKPIPVAVKETIRNFEIIAPVESK